MPTKRDVLAQLSKAEHLSVVDSFELTVAGRRVREGIIDVVASSKKATLAEIVPELPKPPARPRARARLLRTRTAGLSRR